MLGIAAVTAVTDILPAPCLPGDVMQCGQNETFRGSILELRGPQP